MFKYQLVGRITVFYNTLRMNNLPIHHYFNFYSIMITVNQLFINSMIVKHINNIQIQITA